MVAQKGSAGVQARVAALEAKRVTNSSIGGIIAPIDNAKPTTVGAGAVAGLPKKPTPVKVQLGGGQIKPVVPSGAAGAQAGANLLNVPMSVVPKQGVKPTLLPGAQQGANALGVQPKKDVIKPVTPAPLPSKGTTPVIPGTPPVTPPAITPTKGVTPTPTDTFKSKDEMQAELDTAAQIEAKKQADIAMNNARQLEAIKKQSTTINNDISDTNTSITLDKAKNQLDALKQSTAYLGTQGQPGVSSVHLGAIDKQMTDAQVTYNRMVSISEKQHQLQELGVQFDATQFAQQMKGLQDQLDTKVSLATQNIINAFTAEGGKIDTIEEFNLVKDTMLQRLDKSVANIAIANSTERQQILDRYNTMVTQGETFAKNKNVVNEQMSTANKSYTDMNGNVMLDKQGIPIPYLGKPLYSGMDTASGNFVTVTQDPVTGALSAKMVPVGQPSGSDWKPDTNNPGSFYRTVNGKLETSTPGKEPEGPTGVLTPVTFGGKTFQADSAMAPALNSVEQQLNAAGIGWATGAQNYRTKEDQQSLYDKYKAGTGGLAAAPGFSQHEKGLAVDMYSNNGKSSQLLKPTPEMVAIMEANEFKQTAGTHDLGHFDFVGKHKAEDTTQLDLASKSILAQTGLDISQFNYLTQGQSALTRMPIGQQNIVKAKTTEFLNKNGLDYSTFRARYTALNDSLERTTKIMSNVQRDEIEIMGTLENQFSAVDEAGFGKIKVANLVKMFAGEQFNDPAVTEYSFQLSLLQEEIAGYYAALRGDTSPVEADSKKAAGIIVNGISAGGLTGLKNAMTKSVLKLGQNLPTQVNAINKQVWELFGVGDNYGTEGTTTTPGTTAGVARR